MAHFVSNIKDSELYPKCEDKPLKGFQYQNVVTGCVCIAGKTDVGRSCSPNSSER